MCGMTLPMLSLPTVFLGAMSLVLVPPAGLLRRPGAAGPGAPTDRPGPVRRVGADPARHGDDGGAWARPWDLPVWPGKGGGAPGPLAAAMALSCYQSTFGAALNGIGRQGSVAWISILCDGVQLAFTAGLVARPGVGMGGYVLGALVTAAPRSRPVRLADSAGNWPAPEAVPMGYRPGSGRPAHGPGDQSALPGAA